MLESELGLTSKKTRFRLKKLPMWGWGHTKLDKVNFEWPSENQFKLLPAGAFLQSIEISGHAKRYGSASAIKGILSTNEESELIKKPGTNIIHTVRVNFDQGAKRVASIQAHSFSYGGVCKIQFRDK